METGALIIVNRKKRYTDSVGLMLGICDVKDLWKRWVFIIIIIIIIIV